MPTKRFPLQDARKQKRIPLLKNLAEPINIRIPSISEESQPAVMVNLSSGGMMLILFTTVPMKTPLSLIVNLPNLKNVKIEGHVVRVEPKGETCRVAIAFTKISSESARKIDQMAQDYNSCDSRIAMAAEKICYPTCSFWNLCDKPQKGRA